MWICFGKTLNLVKKSCKKILLLDEPKLDQSLLVNKNYDIVVSIQILADLYSIDAKKVNLVILPNSIGWLLEKCVDKQILKIWYIDMNIQMFHHLNNRLQCVKTFDFQSVE